MISFKFSVGGQQIEARIDSAEEAMKVLSALSLRTAKTNVSPKISRKSYYVSNKNNAPRAWQRWTMEEVQAIKENQNLRAKELIKIPVLSGRSVKTLSAMRGCLRNPSRTGAPTNFRKIADVVRASA